MAGAKHDEGGFAAGRQALLEALDSLEQRAQRQAEQVVEDAESRARQILADAERRAAQATQEAAGQLADLERELEAVRESLDLARAQLDEHVVEVRGQVDVARANLQALRERITTTARITAPVPRASEPSGRIAEFRGRERAPRLRVPPISNEPVARSPQDEPVAPPALDDLRAAVDALKKPRRAPEPAPAVTDDLPR